MTGQSDGPHGAFSALPRLLRQEQRSIRSSLHYDPERYSFAPLT